MWYVCIYDICIYIIYLYRYPWHKNRMKYQDVLPPRVCWQQNKHEMETKKSDFKAAPLRRRFRENQSSALRCNKFPVRFGAHQTAKIQNGMKISSGPGAFQNLCRFSKLEKIEPIMAAANLDEAGTLEAMDLQLTALFQRFSPKRLKKYSNNCWGTNEKNDYAFVHFMKQGNRSSWHIYCREWSTMPLENCKVLG